MQTGVELLFSASDEEEDDDDGYYDEDYKDFTLAEKYSEHFDTISGYLAFYQCATAVSG